MVIGVVPSGYGPDHSKWTLRKKAKRWHIELCRTNGSGEWSYVEQPIGLHGVTVCSMTNGGT